MKIQHPKFLLQAFSLIVIILAFGCKDEKVFSLSENDLKMVGVLVDIYTADAALREYRDLNVKDSLKRAYFDQIYQIHHVDSAWISSQRNRLESDPVRMDSVYSRALAAVELIKAKGTKK